jgi:fumarylacetoacetase
VCGKNGLAVLVFQHIFAHQAIGGYGLKSGDIVASGILSSITLHSLGCLLELTMNGKRSFKVRGRASHTWLEDGDGVRTTGFAGSGCDRVGWVECVGEILLALDLKP